MLQQSATEADKVLIAAAVAAARDAGHFTVAGVNEILDLVRVPRPGNTAREVRRLSDRSLVRRMGASGTWAVTPFGDAEVAARAGDIDARAMEARLSVAPGSDFGHARHTLIHPLFAPAKWAPSISRLLARFPFDQNVFLITRFPSDPDDSHYLDPVASAIETIRLALAEHQLVLHLASDRQLDDDLLGNVAAHMWASRYGIGLLEDRVGRNLNYNVMTEIGAMLMTGRRCALFKDTGIPSLPTDVAGQIYKEVDLADQAAVSQATHLWAAEDLGLGHCHACPSV